MLIASWFALVDNDNCSKLIPELEQKLYVFENAMPRLYSVKDTDYSLDHKFPIVCVHRLIIQLYTNACWCWLYRPVMFSTSDVYPYNNETKIKLYNRATDILQCTHDLTLNKRSLATCTPPYFTFEGGFMICICVLSEIERSNTHNEHILDKFVTTNKITDIIAPLDMAIDDLKFMCSVSTLAIKGMTILQHLRTLCQRGLAKFTHDEPRSTQEVGHNTPSYETSSFTTSDHFNNPPMAHIDMLQKSQQESSNCATKVHSVNDFLQSLPDPPDILTLDESESWIGDLQYFNDWSI